MNVIDNEKTMFWDIDDTLVLRSNLDPNNLLNVYCPYDYSTIVVTPHLEHIKCLKDHKARNYHITVWSHGGAKWAEAVIIALGLENYVDEIRTKPLKAFDDRPVAEIFGETIYIPYTKKKV